MTEAIHFRVRSKVNRESKTFEPVIPGVKRLALGSRGPPGTGIFSWSMEQVVVRCRIPTVQQLVNGANKELDSYHNVPSRVYRELAGLGVRLLT